jgi:flagellar hook-associated protein 3 FlgL
MDRVSTVGTYQSALASIMLAEQNQATADQQVSSGKVATDLGGFGDSSERLVATRTLQSRLQSYSDNSQILSAKLGIQDTALTQMESAAGDAVKAIHSAIASGDASNLMASLQNSLTSAASSINLQYQGQYVFAGSQVSTAPLAITNINALATAGTPVALNTVFKNDQFPPKSRLDDNTVATTGFVADAVASPYIQVLQQVAAYNQGPNGPFGKPLTAAQTTFLQGVVQTAQAAQQTVTNVTVQNGGVQNQVTNVQKAISAQQTALTNIVSNITDVDVAQAATNLQLAQASLQAAAQVFSRLSGSALVNLLPSTSTTA